ncbi:MAG: undecaprenyldiphospho-muramoylpentapeptide beta-N-acetylglucosaminyltransferase [Pelosinus sp.]|nr:undecaprenyldiphospho-muramoylpentapeptide beta-N-acetylglucosaminyltransferase [Pelosinus sp.]
MRIIVSGGGTGGHIYPAITIIRAIERLVGSCEILYVGTNRGLEADIIPKEGLAFKAIEVSGFVRRLTLQNVAILFKSLKSVWDAKKIVDEFKPDVVIGTGGYVCGPILLAASLKGVPTIIQEQNVIPGITNKILARFVRKIALGYQEAGKYFSVDQTKMVYTGNPIRREVMECSRTKGISALGLNPERKTILISGGSRGAHSINQAMLKVHKHFNGRTDVQLLHVTGKSEYNDIVRLFAEQGIDVKSSGNIIIKPYLYNMPEALAAADLAVFRAGAVGLAELTARGIPSVLVPYPYAAENHQEFNARVMEKSGAALAIRDADLDGLKLSEVLENLVSDPAKLNNMAVASKKLGCPEAADQIAKLVVTLCNK